MFLPLTPFLRRRAVLGAWFLGGLAGYADYKDEVGYTRLQTELGAALPTGAGIGVTQVEAPEGSSGTIFNYLPATTLAEFAGKTFTKKNGDEAVSGHATQVAQTFYGSVSSIAPGITAIDVYNANDWLSGFLRRSTFNAPSVENQDVQNHSWVGTSADTQSLRRFDFAIQRDDFVAVVGVNNGAGSAVPPLFGNAYNGISVGLSNGGASYGLTTNDGSGRVKPEIVSPFTQTSFATPSVSAAAALLLQKARGTAVLASAEKSVVMKAILLAGATKSQFPGWNRTATRPLDAQFGAGQLNIYNSYQILTAGRQAASGSVSVATRGWDASTTIPAGRRYFFDVLAGDTASGFSALLTWNRTISGNWPNGTTSSLADLSLKIYAANGFTLGAQVDASTSAVDNVEHLYEPNLPPGRYALEVSATQPDISFGLAWYSVRTVTVAATTPTASEQTLSPGAFTIMRAGPTTAALTLNYTISGTATAGADYQAIANAVTIPAGASAATITISPLADALAEGDETVTLTVTSDFAYGLAGAGSATVTIQDKPIDAWRFSNFTAAELGNPAISGDLADADSDGLENLIEYAFSLPPKIPGEQALPVAAVDANGNPAATYSNAPDVTVTVEVSTDLLTWQTATTALAAKVSAAAASSPEQRFTRFRVTR